MNSLEEENLDLRARATFFTILIIEDRYTKIGRDTLHAQDWDAFAPIAETFHDDATALTMVGTLAVGLMEIYNLPEMASNECGVWVTMEEALRGVSWRNPAPAIDRVLVGMKAHPELTDQDLKHLKDALEANVENQSNAQVASTKMLGSMWCRLAAGSTRTMVLPPGAGFTRSRMLTNAALLAATIKRVAGRDGFNFKNPPRDGYTKLAP
jgi:hypothetical protein